MTRRRRWLTGEAPRRLALGGGLLLVLVLAVAGVSTLAGGEAKRPPAAPPVSKPVTLRVYSSLPVAALPGERLDDVAKAVAVAFEERGSQVGTHRVELVALDSNAGRDSGWEAGQVVTNARQASRDDTAIAYIGEIASGASGVSAPVMNRVAMLQVAPGGGNLGLTRAGGHEGEPAIFHPSGARTFVRVWPGDHLEAAAMVQWLRELRAKRLVVVDARETSDQGVSQLVAEQARGSGIEVQRLRFNVRRLATIRDAAARAAAFRADTLVFTGIWQNRAVALWGRMHRSNPSMRLIGGGSLAEEPFTRELTRSARARTYLTRPEVPTDRLPRTAQTFVARFEQRHGRPPHPQAVYGYEAARLVLDALAGAPPGGPALVRRHVLNEVFATRGRAGVPGGRYSIDDHGDITRAAFGGYRVDERGDMVFERLLIAGEG